MSSSAAFSPELNHHHLPPPSDELCYVQCNYCNTVLAVSVPGSSMSLATVTVRCGHCSKLLYVSMRAYLPPPPAATASAETQSYVGHNFFSHQNIMEEARNNPSNMFINQQIPDPFGPIRMDELLKPPVVNRPPEKRQRVPSAYNRFIKEEIQRIKAGNPDISHREAFSTAAKNWAHFPHIHFGLMPDQPLKKPDVCQQEGDGMRMKDVFLSAGDIGVSPL